MTIVTDSIQITEHAVHSDERGTVYELKQRGDARAHAFRARQIRDGQTFEIDFPIQDPTDSTARSIAFTRAVRWLQAMTDTRIKSAD